MAVFEDFVDFRLIVSAAILILSQPSKTKKSKNL
jgi:hypothetical protein